MIIKDQLVNFKKNVQNKTTGEDNIYEAVGIVYPYTVLNNGQFGSFVSSLANDDTLGKNINDAFNALWDIACIDMGSYGNNIWNLKKGQFTYFNQNGISAGFEKVGSEGIDKYYEQGRGTFVIKTSDGNMVIKQHEYNRDIFLVYLSANVSEKFYEAVKNAEASALNIIRREQTTYEFNSEVKGIETSNDALDVKRL